MISYILARVLQSFVVMLCVAAISFSLFTYVGDPIANLVGIQSSDEKRENEIVKDEVGYIPLHQQALSWGVRKGVTVAQRADNALQFWYINMK